MDLQTDALKQAKRKAMAGRSVHSNRDEGNVEGFEEVIAAMGKAMDYVARLQPLYMSVQRYFNEFHNGRHPQWHLKVSAQEVVSHDGEHTEFTKAVDWEEMELSRVIDDIAVSQAALEQVLNSVELHAKTQEVCLPPFALSFSDLLPADMQRRWRQIQSGAAETASQERHAGDDNTDTDTAMDDHKHDPQPDSDAALRENASSAAGSALTTARRYSLAQSQPAALASFLMMPGCYIPITRIPSISASKRRLFVKVSVDLFDGGPDSKPGNANARTIREMARHCGIALQLLHIGRECVFCAVCFFAVPMRPLTCAL